MYVNYCGMYVVVVIINSYGIIEFYFFLAFPYITESSLFMN